MFEKLKNVDVLIIDWASIKNKILLIIAILFFAGFTIGITAMILMIAFILNTVKLAADTDSASRREESRKQIMVNLFAIALLGAINLLILMFFGLLR